MEWFRTRREAAATIEIWRQHYNAVRPHSSLGYVTPNEFRAKQVVTTTQSGEAVLSFYWSEEPRQVRQG